jgi:hypothetical protein
VEGVADAGAKYISALAAMLDVENEEQIAEVANQVADLAGYLYRFTAPVSTLKAKRV